MKSAKSVAVLAFLILLPLLTTSCFWGDEYKTKQLIGNYYLSKAEPDAEIWYLYFEEKDILGEPLFNRWIEKVGFNNRCIIMWATGASPQFYVALITAATTREDTIANLRGPMTKDEFQNVMREINGDTLLQFNSSLTKSGW